MKIPIIYPGFKGKLIIEKSYYYNVNLISLGCDCHPAYLLQKLHLRKSSLPFDWLNTNPLMGIEFVNSNILSDFQFFLEDLKINERGYIVSEKFDYSEFMHEKNLISNLDSKAKFNRRINRFTDTIKNESVFYLYNITSVSINSKICVDKFFEDVIYFMSLIKETDKLHIYIRFDESYEENHIYCSLLLDKLNQLKNVKSIYYLRETSKYGTWGNESQYKKILNLFDIKIKSRFFPKFYLKKSN